MQLMPLDLLNLSFIWVKTYPGLRKTWPTANNGIDRSEIRVNYGYEHVPGTKAHVFGGMVKLQDLNSEFSHHSERPNILYLVSSALPYFPVRMAKMAKHAGAKIVINQNGVAYPGWHGKGWEQKNKPMRELLELADYVIYQSKFCKMSADRFLGRCNVEHEILYNPVNTNIFRPVDESDDDDQPATILLAGSHWSFYRPKVALEVLRELKQRGSRVRLKIAGRYCWGRSPADATQQVNDLAKRLGVVRDFEYVGPYTQQEAVILLQSCSVLLHTKYNDPCPRLVVEAMACALPVVYSATGGVPELVDHSAGIGVPGPLDWHKDHPPDTLRLAEAVLEVLENSSTYAKQARERAEQYFRVETWLAEHRAIFTRLLSH
jgi:glycosyltransferase involved in cell wall biosynthesis